MTGAIDYVSETPVWDSAKGLRGLKERWLVELLLVASCQAEDMCAILYGNHSLLSELRNCIVFRQLVRSIDLYNLRIGQISTV